MLCLAGELDPDQASRWFEAYVRHFWVGEGLAWGFRETPRGTPQFSDVDAGPVVFGVGAVASAFGIGAARSVGRYDYAAPLTMQAVAASWPTPFGLLIPGAMGAMAADGWCFGELALTFSMTRPNTGTGSVPYRGKVPASVWLATLAYLSAALLILLPVASFWRRRWLTRRASGSPSAR